MYAAGFVPTRRQQILSMLIEARIKNDIFLVYRNPVTTNPHYISGGYRPTWAFRDQFTGGDCGDRRCRELRADHKPADMPKNDWIQKKTHRLKYWDAVKGKMRSKSIVIFRLKMSADKALAYPWHAAFILPFKWVYREFNGQVESGL